MLSFTFPPFLKRFTQVAACVSMAFVSSRSFGAGWTPIPNPPSIYAGIELQLTDGSVLVQDSDANDWWKLSPDATGNYVNGTWTQVASTPSTYGPLYFASAVLADGRVIVIGGEYNLGVDTYTTTGYIYDPVANTWTALAAPTNWPYVGDAQCAVLPNGKFMLANLDNTDSAILDPTTLTWSDSGDGKLDRNDEEGWTLLPDGTIFTLDDESQPGSERYLPTQNKWIGAAASPVTLVDTADEEEGPQVLLPNGTVFAAGAVGKTAIYTPPTTLTGTGSWTVGPTFPLDNGKQLEIPDGPGCLMPNGHVLCAASPGYAVPSLGTKFFEYDGTHLNETALTVDSPSDSCYQFSLMVLPNGQVLCTDQSSDIEIYTPDGFPQNSWTPTISTVSSSLTVGTTYPISGTQFNGLSQANFYGDDNSNATNYPLVRITNTASGTVTYCRTHGHSTMGVATGSLTTSTSFDIPATIPTGASTIQVVANGIASPATAVTITTSSGESISGLSLTPSSVAGGGTSTGTVTLATAAPSGGWLVDLTSQIPSYVAVPTSITIPAGSTTGTFSITTKSFRQSYTNIVTATGKTNHTTATLTITDDSISGLTLSPTSVKGGAGSTGTITLLQAAPTEGWTVKLTSQIPSYVGVPASVKIAAGSTTGTFAITTKSFRQNYTNNITATDATSTKTVTFSIVDDSISALTLSPTSVKGGAGSTGTITLLQAAPTGGWTVNLTSQIPSYVGVPASVTIAAGSTTGTFAVTTKLFRQSYTNVITATDATSSKPVTLSIVDDSISGLSLSPSTLLGGAGSTGTITLLQAAPAGGWTVNLTSQIPSYVGVPASVTIAAGSTTGTFAITTKAFRQTYTNNIIATDATSTKTVTLTVDGDSIASLTLSPSSVVGGNKSTGTITLLNAAPVAWTIQLTSQIPSYVGVPASITIPAGSTTGTFTITTKTFRSNYTNTITAADSASSKVSTLTITTS